MNANNWACVYTTAYVHMAEIIKDTLLQAGIDAVIVNKQDSVYKFGEIEVYVNIDNILSAKQLIKNSEL